MKNGIFVCSESLIWLQEELEVSRGWGAIWDKGKGRSGQLWADGAVFVVVITVGRFYGC